MQMEQCNPYVRFASAIQLSGVYRPTVSRDHRLFYFLKGDGAICINGKTYSVSDNTAVLFPAGSVYLCQPKEKIATLSFNFDYTQAHRHLTYPLRPVEAAKMGDESLLERVDFSDHPALCQPIFLEDAAALLTDLYRIIEEVRSQKPLAAAYSSSLMKKVLCKVVRLASLQLPQKESQLEAILSYIHRHYSEPLCNRSLAETIGYHPYYVNRLMNRYVGTTLHQYLMNYRLSVAADLLLETDDAIEHIAGAVGFADAAYFAAGFKKKYGESPTRYRKQHQRMP